jgi:hypothetical protein
LDAFERVPEKPLRAMLLQAFYASASSSPEAGGTKGAARTSCEPTNATG